MRNSAELLQKVRNNPGLILIKFTADWCGPCKKIKPLVDQYLEELPEDKVHYYEIDIDEHLDVYAFLKNKKMVNVYLHYWLGNLKIQHLFLHLLLLVEMKMK